MGPRAGDRDARSVAECPVGGHCQLSSILGHDELGILALQILI
jgi:hypothetical protein